jgi:hypothetical protein
LIESSVVRECVSGRRCVITTQGQGFPFETNGSWQITTTLSASENKLSGSAILVLTNGRAFNFAASGVYSPKTGLSTVKLIGTGESTGAHLTVAIRGSDKAVIRVRGVVLGQRLHWTN